MSDTNTSAGQDPQLVDLLVCPVTRGRLNMIATILPDRPSSQAFIPIRHGIPIMLEGEATPLEDLAQKIMMTPTSKTWPVEISLSPNKAILTVTFDDGASLH